MKKLLLVITVAVIAAAWLKSGMSVSGEGKTFNPEKELTRSACVGVVGEPIVNVEHKVVNDADSGFGGYWAYDTYKRLIKVYKTITPDSYCALVTYEGKFVTFAGRSPNNTGTVGDGIKGEMKGGYRATFNGKLKAVPLKPTHGNLGTFDYQCDKTGNCPGVVNWRGFYFDNVTGFDQPWWGWRYSTERNGSWINASTGSLGDITGVRSQGPKDVENEGHDD